MDKAKQDVEIEVV